MRELERRKYAYEVAREEFRIVISEVPSGLPHPDGASRITLSGMRTNSALHSYMQAVRDLNGFIVHGVIPRHLKPHV